MTDHHATYGDQCPDCGRFYTLVSHAPSVPARLETLCGHDLDGDQHSDGYSLDRCHEIFTAGKNPTEALDCIRAERAATPSDF